MNPSEKVLCCPRCKGTDILVFEVIEAISEHRIVNGVWLHEHDNNEYGNGLGIECLCQKCGHRFKSRRGEIFDNYYLEER